jgi:hypothetical protein
MKVQAFLFASRAPAATILIRLMVGAVFLSEGIQKFLFPDALGVGRFAKIGIPYPEVMAPFVGVFEIRSYNDNAQRALVEHWRQLGGIMFFIDVGKVQKWICS